MEVEKPKQISVVLFHSCNINNILYLHLSLLSVLIVEKKKMKNIKTFFQMMIQILREESDGDLMYYLESINTPEEAFKVIKTLRNELVDRSQQELNKEMKKYHFISKENLIGTFATIVEKQRGYPLGMGEYSDIEDWAKAWADDSEYARLFIEEDGDDWVENRKDYLFDDLNNILFKKHSELIEYIKDWLTKHKLADDSMIVGELASEFIDKKELYDLDYDD